MDLCPSVIWNKIWHKLEQMAWSSVVSVKCPQMQENTKQLWHWCHRLNFISISNHSAHLSCAIFHQSLCLFLFLNPSHSPSGRRSLSFSEGLVCWWVSISICCILGRLRWQSLQLRARTKSQWCGGVRRLGWKKGLGSAVTHPWNRWRGTGAVPVLVHASWHQSSPRWAISRKRGGGNRNQGAGGVLWRTSREKVREERKRVNGKVSRSGKSQGQTHVNGARWDRSISAQTELKPSLSPETLAERDVKDILHTNSVRRRTSLLKHVPKNVLCQGKSQIKWDQMESMIIFTRPKGVSEEISRMPHNALGYRCPQWRGRNLSMIWKNILNSYRTKWSGLCFPKASYAWVDRRD